MRVLCLLLYLVVLCSVDSSEYVEPMYLDRLFSQGRYEEASKLLDVDPSVLDGTTNYGRHNPNLYGGDILLTERQQEQVRQGGDFITYPDLKWDTVIPYYISPEYPLQNKTQIERGIRLFNSYSKGVLEWIPWEQATEEEKENYVYFYNGTGCDSHLGKKGGMQVLNLNIDGCLDLGGIIHEMNHACGMQHEHQRKDREKYIHVNFNNIKKDWYSEWVVINDTIILGDYDLCSIMHYECYNSEVTIAPGYRTFDVLEGTVMVDCNCDTIGRAQAFTDEDIKKLHALYNLNTSK